MKIIAKGFFYFLLIVAMLTTLMFNMAQFTQPKIVSKTNVLGSATFIPQSELGIHQLILEGSAYERGRLAGEKTKDILKRQEDALYEKLNYWLPSRFLQKTAIIAATLWFQGIEKYYYPWTLSEMYGVSRSAADEYDFLATKYMRQVGYHGLHEVGQMMVDRGFEDFGCTVLAKTYKKSWVLGRNFDFEGGRIFDEEKIMKWVFPTDEGNAYLSVIWAGMVGAVTGVNEHGIYISINAAGSDDFVRLGTPSTLITLKVLQFAKSADEAIEILKTEKMLITDIFVVMDSKNGRLFRVEKSPLKTAVIELHDRAVITNHLISEEFKGDKTNEDRKLNLTSHHREERGYEILSVLNDPVPNSHGIMPAIENIDLPSFMVEFLRDKKALGNKPLNLGNRRAIDALIATHAVVFDGSSQTFYVSRGPSLQGEFLGFDLTASFKEKRPITVRKLPADRALTQETYKQTKDEFQLILAANRLLKKRKCLEAKNTLDKVQTNTKSSEYLMSLADTQSCLGDKANANKLRQNALEATPPYLRQIQQLQAQLKGL